MRAITDPGKEKASESCRQPTNEGHNNQLINREITSRK
jgi:hypothetical protein